MVFESNVIDGFIITSPEELGNNHIHIFLIYYYDLLNVMRHHYYCCLLCPHLPLCLAISRQITRKYKYFFIFYFFWTQNVVLCFLSEIVEIDRWLYFNNKYISIKNEMITAYTAYTYVFCPKLTPANIVFLSAFYSLLEFSFLITI